MRAGESDRFEVGERYPNQFGSESFARGGREVDRLGDLKTRDAAAFFREQFAARRAGAIEAGVFGRGQLVDVAEAFRVTRGAVQKQRAIAFAPNACDGDLLDLPGREPRKRLRSTASGCRAVSANRTGEAERLLTEADGRPEFHHRLVVIARRGGAGDERIGEERE